MKKTILFSLILIAAASLFSSCEDISSQSSKDYHVEDSYNSIIVDNGVDLRYSECESIKGYSANMSALLKLEVYVEDNVLYVRIPGRTVMHKPVTVDVPMLENVKYIKVSDASSFSASVPVSSSDELVISVEDMSSASFCDITASSLKFKVDDASSAVVKSLTVADESEISVESRSSLKLSGGSTVSLFTDVNNASSFTCKRKDGRYSFTTESLSGSIDNASKMNVDVTRLIDYLSVDNVSVLRYSGDPEVGKHIEVDNLSDLSRK